MTLQFSREWGQEIHHTVRKKYNHRTKGFTDEETLKARLGHKKSKIRKQIPFADINIKNRISHSLAKSSHKNIIPCMDFCAARCGTWNCPNPGAQGIIPCTDFDWRNYEGTNYEGTH